MTATTGEDGSFSIAGAPAGSVTLMVAAEGYEDTQIVANAGTPAAVVLDAVPPPTRIVTGLVESAGDKTPIGGARVTVQGTQTSTMANADGFFVLVGVPTTDLLLSVSASGYQAQTIGAPAGSTSVRVAMQSTTPTTQTPEPQATTRTITGRVVEESTGEPIAGAEVAVRGTDKIALTEGDGSFVIEGVPMETQTLEVFSLSHQLESVQVLPGTERVDIALSLARGEQIVVVGRAPQIVRENLANGASVVRDDELNRVPQPTLESALQGKIPGANIQANSGAPGGGLQLRLRGISTINGQASPLFVVDGVIVSNTAISSGANAITSAASGGNASSQDNPVNRIADLNLNDIESVEVLKGASAAALYGSKAANGVVIITTKRGRGKPKVTVTQRLGFSQVSNTLGSRVFESADEVMAAYGSQAAVDAFNAAGGRVFDHEDELTRTPLLSETIASASGSTEDANYYGSILVRDEPGVVRETFYEKQSGKLSVGYDFSERVSVNATGNVVHSVADRGLTNNDNTGTSYYMALSSTPSFIDLRPNNGLFPDNPFANSNPLQTTALLDNEEEVWRFIGASNATFKVFKNDTHSVNVLGNFGVDRFQQENNIVSPPSLQFEPNDGQLGTVVDGDTTNLNWNAGFSTVWGFTPRDAGWRSALSVGFTHEEVDTIARYVVASNLVAGQPNIDSATSVQTNELRLRTKDQGIYLQEEVALLEDSLSLLAGLLAERSSLNGDTDQLFLFPKFAAHYSLPVAEEQFNILRVRGAYGEAGNRPNFGQKFTPLNAGTTIDGNPGLTLGGNAGDPEIEPERQREVELGVDAETSDQFALVELSVYQRNISNLLLQRTLPTSTGFTTEFFNGGGLRNRGVEAAVQLRPVESAVTWTTRATFTMNRSQVTDLPEGIPFFDITAAGFGAGLGAYRIEPGKSATQIVGSAGDDGVIPIGDGEPDFRVGWLNEITYGRFGLETLVDWQQGSEIVNLTRLLYDFGQISPDFTTDGMERLDAFLNGDIRPYVERGTFVKLREVTLNYDVPEEIAQQIGPLATLRASVSGRNLLTFTGYSGLDPEVSNFGNQPIGRNFDVAPYPPSRSFWFSLAAGF